MRRIASDIENDVGDDDEDEDEDDEDEEEDGEDGEDGEDVENDFDDNETNRKSHMIPVNEPDDDYDDDASMNYVRVSRRHHQAESHNRCCDRRFWCIKDICGFVCCIFTWLLICYAEYVIVFIVLLPSRATFARFLNLVLFQCETLLALLSHLRTMLSDPGAVPKGNATKEMIQYMGFKEGQMIFTCQKCCSVKPERAHHCSICQRCIRKMDHHCPWVNNCVGENNQKYFVLFTLYVALISIHAFLIAVNQLIYCVKHEWTNCSTYSPPSTAVFILIVIIEALLFGIFTIIMLFTQMQAICNDETGIEQLKKEEARWRKRTRWSNVQTVFGPFSLAWLIPFRIPSFCFRKTTAASSDRKNVAVSYNDAMWSAPNTALLQPHVEYHDDYDNYNLYSV